MLNFGEILTALKAGHAAMRAGWNGKGMFVKLQVPDSGSKMSLPYIYMKTADNQLVPWLASQTDILASDWAIWTHSEPENGSAMECDKQTEDPRRYR